MNTTTLVNPRFGIVRALEPADLPVHFPTSFRLVHSRISDTRRFSPWPADESGAGYSFGDSAAAAGAALGEAVERYCGNLVRTDLISGSFRDLSRRGLSCLDPERLCLFSPSQHAVPGFPAEPITRQLATEWVGGTDVADGSPVLVPAAIVWPSYFATDRPGRGPLTNPVIQAGLAAGRDWPHAVASALAELVERDAMTLSWWGARGVRRVRAPRWFLDLAAGPSSALSAELYAFDDEFGLTVLGALVEDRTTGYLTLGMGTGADPTAAVLKALGESLQLQLYVAEYDDPASPFARAATSPTSPLKPWRADRRYAESYRPDRSDVVDYACHLQLHLDPRVQETFRTELAALTMGTTTELADLADVAGDSVGLADRLIAAGHQLVSVDLTTDDVRPTGLRALRMIATGLYSNAPMGLPFEGGQRLDQARTAACASGRPLATIPLPH